MNPVNNKLAIGGILDEFNGASWQTFFQGLQESHNTGNIYQSYTVARLPAGKKEGQTAYAVDGRKVGEGAGAGTGVPVYYSNGQWRVYSTDLTVTS